MAGRHDRNPFDEEDEVNPFADGGGKGQTKFSGGAFYTTSAGSVPAATNSRLSPLPHEPADFYDRTAPVDIPLDSASDLKQKEKELQAKEAELKRREQKSKTGPRWKGKGAERKALSDPISATIVQLQSSLLQSKSRGILTSSSVLLDTDAYRTDLLSRACFGRPYATADKDKQWFQLSNEEAFYLFYVLKCIRIVDVAENYIEKNAEQLLIHMSSNQKNFVNLFKAYSHLRLKNWVVRSGSQYGVDFVAYRHHPSLVHSEYAVLVLSENDGEAANGRLQVWSDVHCTLRLCGSVAKTLLLLNIQKHGKKSESLANLDSYTVEERTITRWSPEQAKELRIQENVS